MLRTYKPQGFTLLEVMVTLAILALLVALVAPKFALQKTSVKAVTQQAETLFQFAKAQAIAQQKNISVSVNETEGVLHQLSVIDYGVGTGNILDVYIPEDTVAVSFNPKLSEIIFSPTAPVKIKVDGLTRTLTTPINIYFSADTQPNLIVFPNSGRVLKP